MTDKETLHYKGKKIETLSKEELIEAVYYLYAKMKEDEKIKQQYIDILRAKP